MVDIEVSLTREHQVDPADLLGPQQIPRKHPQIHPILQLPFLVLTHLEMHHHPIHPGKLQSSLVQSSIIVCFSWTKRIQNSIKNSILGTPRFHRRKQSTQGSTQSISDRGSSELDPYLSNSTSTDSEKKSWFKDVWNSVNQETNYSIIIDEENPQKVKNQLIQVTTTLIKV